MRGIGVGFERKGRSFLRKRSKVLLSFFFPFSSSFHFYVHLCVHSSLWQHKHNAKKSLRRVRTHRPPWPSSNSRFVKAPLQLLFFAFALSSLFALLVHSLILCYFLAALFTFTLRLNIKPAHLLFLSSFLTSDSLRAMESVHKM